MISKISHLCPRGVQLLQGFLASHFLLLFFLLNPVVVLEPDVLLLNVQHFEFGLQRNHHLGAQNFSDLRQISFVGAPDNSDPLPAHRVALSEAELGHVGRPNTVTA